MCNNIDLSAYGLNGRFAALAAEYPGLTAARVVAQEKGRYDLLSARGEASGAVSGRFRHAVQTVSEFPAVGDFVMTDWNPDGEAVIRHVLPRKSCLLRRAAGDVRGDGRGRHTTTRRALFRLPAGGLVIDTPGMRELGLWDAGDGLDRTFSDVEALAARCRFCDCTHTGEPGCAVAQALETGSLDRARWQSYQKLRTEQDFAADSAGWLAAKEKKFKEISKINKANRSRSSGK